MSEMNNTIVSTTDLNKQKKEVNPNTNHLKLYRGEKNIYKNPTGFMGYSQENQ